MYAKVITPNEIGQLTDIGNIQAAIGGKYARIIVECYVKDNIEHFTISIAPPEFGEHNKEIKVREHIQLCKGVLDFQNVSKAVKILYSMEDNQEKD